MYDIPHDLGTACNVQAMVFGNKGKTSATGVGFTRDPSTGEKKFYGEYLTNAQGEDVVAGIRTPKPIDELESELPDAYRQLREITQRLENHYRDVQDFEFTIEEQKLYMLQTRTGKRTGPAAVRIACDMVDEKLITPEEAVMRVDPNSLDQLLHPVFDPAARRKIKPSARGLPASPGAASGELVFTADDAEAKARRGKRVVLIRKETVPDDIHGMKAAQGVLTATGGMTSHAAVVGRQMGKPSVVGCGALVIDEKSRTVKVGGKTYEEGDAVSLDGGTGEVFFAEIPTTPSEILRVVDGKLKEDNSLAYHRFKRLLDWSDGFRRLEVRANADIPKDAKTAFAFGAHGIGLCRTEHMFFAEERLPIVVEMILADTLEGRLAALKKLLPMQRADFYGLFKEMRGYAVTIRTLDPPLHEFLPKREDLMVEIAKLESKRGAPKAKLARLKKLLARVEDLHEFNPMLGFRGCRLGIVFPEITEMQVRAIFEAAARCVAEGRQVKPEVMIPLVGSEKELKAQKDIVVRVAEEVMAEKKVRVEYLAGTMIEVPRGALVANEIAREAQFFSFGTNDLTQMTFGFSRDDIGKFLFKYLEADLLPRDPFVSVDRDGVGELMRIAVQKGRATRPDLKIGICGEHGGDPSSVEFCHELGLNYVSCSPYRVPVARLAAAQAALKSKAQEGKKAA
jgi:pyruvate,orthophosphate dikinase